MAARPHPPIACARPCPYFATHPHKSTLRSKRQWPPPIPNSFKARKTLKVGSRSYTYFSLKAVEKEVGDLSRLPFSLRVLLENLLRHEDGTHGQEDRHRRLRRLAEERRQVGQGDQLPAGPRADAGLHRRAGGGRPRRHARRHGRAGRRRQEDQSAGAGRPRHRPFGDRRQFRQCQRLRRQRRSSNTSATSSATSSCAGARWRSTISASCRRAPASATRSTSNTWRRSCGPRRKARRRSPIPTRWSAPTATPPW